MTPKKIFFYVGFFCLFIIINACKSTQTFTPVYTSEQEISLMKLGGGSSGMAQYDDQSYLVVYDVKVHKDDVRMGFIRITDEALQVAPIKIDNWDEEGRSSDLESISKIPNRKHEFLVAESGNWQGKFGRIFHIKVDTAALTGQVLGSIKLPLLNRNDFDLVGDQYEAIACLASNNNQLTLLLGERGGSKVYPNGIIRWGTLDLTTYELTFSEAGLEGIFVEAPGNWIDERKKRNMTDFYIDENGQIWTVGSEDQGDAGPFYSVIYKLGEIDATNVNRPFSVNEKFDTWKEVVGFKIEALSGPSKNIDCTLSFGTEDEMYGGVWRAIKF